MALNAHASRPSPISSPGSNGFIEAAQLSAHFDNPPPNPYQASNYGLSQEDNVSLTMGLAVSRPSPSALLQTGQSSMLPPPLSSTGTYVSPARQWPPPGSRDLQQSNHLPSDHHSPIDSTLSTSDDFSVPYCVSHGSTLRPQASFAARRRSGTGKITNGRPPVLSPPNVERGADASSQGPKLRSRQLGKIFAAPIDRPRSLDDVAPRATFLSVISLYFHHLYPLMPIVHQPSFSHDLITRRDERDADFLSFVLSLTAYTLIQCPRSVIPAPWPFYRKLHQICHLTSRRMQLERHTKPDPPTLTQCATLYTTHIYMGSTSRTFAANAIHGELVRTAFSINLHDEMRPIPTVSSLPDNGSAVHGPPLLNEIERQLRRRLYYLIYGSDKTISVLSDEPISLRDADTVAVEIPVAVDDDMIFPHKIGEQPVERGPSILSGFEAVSKLHRIMSDLVENFRADRRTPPSNAKATRLKLQYARSVLYQIQAVISDMPDVLRQPSFEHAEPPPRPPGGLPDLGTPFYHSQVDIGNASCQTGPCLRGAGTCDASKVGNVQLAIPPIYQSPAPTLPFAPWPTGTFDEHGLPIPTDGASQTSSSAAASPTAPWTHVVPATQGNHQGMGQPLRISRPESPVMPSTAQLKAAREQVVAFRPSPPLADLTHGQVPILSGFAICRANILVTEAMLRFVLVDYQELLQGYLARQRQEEEGSAMSDLDAEDAGVNDIEEAARSFFAEAVASLPLDALAANGQSLILKLVFIVSSLLNRTSNSSRAFSYMSEFLQTLSRLSERRTAGDEDPGSEDEEVPLPFV